MMTLHYLQYYNNRLDDFEHHLLNDEQSIVDTLRKVDGETELRRFISFWLHQNSRGAYTATQEAVVISEKRTLGYILAAWVSMHHLS